MQNRDKKPVLVAAAVIMRDGKILIAERGSQNKYAGWWEFPGGKAGPGEDLRRCVEREIQEELGMIISQLEKNLHLPCTIIATSASE